MKYRKRFIICNLLAGLIALTISCNKEQPLLVLEHSRQLDFPSASAIEYHQNKLYLFGDDATHILVLSPAHEVMDSIRYWQGQEKRISKAEKPDIESSFVREENGQHLLYGVGSMSDSKRWPVIVYNMALDSMKTTSFFDTTTTFPDVEAINIEGSFVFSDEIVFANRANLSNPVNHLLYWNHDSTITSQRLMLPANRITAGVSGMYYVKEKDLLFFTASEEETASTTKDGAIGESYIGWIQNFSQKKNSASLKPDRYLQLSKYDNLFRQQKIESVAVENITGKTVLLHLVADNDNGSSKIFKVRLEMH